MISSLHEQSRRWPDGQREIVRVSSKVGRFGCCAAVDESGKGGGRSNLCGVDRGTTSDGDEEVYPIRLDDLHGVSDAFDGGVLADLVGERARRMKMEMPFQPVVVDTRPPTISSRS
jgi:hypothetical protein